MICFFDRLLRRCLVFYFSFHPSCCCSFNNIYGYYSMFESYLEAKAFVQGKWLHGVNKTIQHDNLYLEHGSPAHFSSEFVVCTRSLSIMMNRLPPNRTVRTRLLPSYTLHVLRKEHHSLAPGLVKGHLYRSNPQTTRRLISHDFKSFIVVAILKSVTRERHRSLPKSAISPAFVVGLHGLHCIGLLSAT
jgi:hypothetical protein